MSRSTHTQAKRSRAAYTGEPRSIADARLGRGGTHGLDDCDPAQRTFRAHLALMLLNRGIDLESLHPNRSFAMCSAHRLLNEGITVSPAYIELTFLTSMPGHLVQKVAPGKNDLHGFPGLRALQCPDDHSWFRFVYLPTNAYFRLSLPPDKPRDWPRSWPRRPDGWSRNPDHTPTEPERYLLDSVPPMTPEAEILLAGLVSRLCLRDPAGQWAIGEFQWDPLDRGFPSLHSRRSYLWGRHNEWILHFNGPTPARDVALALTDPAIGVAGATATWLGEQEVQVRLGESTLTISTYTAPYDRFDG